MQKQGIVNSHIAKVVADLGHTDTICIADCGLPVPPGVLKIDVALSLGTPTFEEVVRTLFPHIKVEGLHIAAPMKEENPYHYHVLRELYPEDRFDWTETSHEEFKKATAQCKCIIRTGENSPYANVILRADCIFAPER